MEDIRSGKHRKRYRKDKSSGNGERSHARHSSQKATTSVLACLNNTEKSFEKQIPRKQLTQGRITTRPGLFHQGKCTSFVHRALCFSPSKKARMDEDLHRIIQLANGIPVEDPKYINVTERHRKVDSYESPPDCCSRTESVEVCNDSSFVSENFIQESMQKKSGNERPTIRLSKKQTPPNIPGHNKMETETSKGRSHVEKMLYTLSSASSSSNGSPSCSSVNYSSPSLAEYEKFTAAVILPLNSKKLLLFSDREYIKETRGRIKTIIHRNKVFHQVNTTDAAIQEDRMSFTSGGSPFNDQSRISTVARQTAEIEMPISPSNQHAVDDFSPYTCILSPKTTILNPIEYLKRVEQANRQREKTFFDSGHESGQSHGSSLTKSQGETNISHDLQKSDTSHYSLEANECSAQSQNMGDSLLYQHSNRSFIDSPQAFKIRDGTFEIPSSQCAYASINSHRPYDNLDVRLEHDKPFQRIPSNLNAEHDVPGLRYLMDIAEIGHSSSSLRNPCDLLDELDALACDPVMESSVVSMRDLRRPVSTTKQWGPPPTPPTPEHKFYRRKMF